MICQIIDDLCHHFRYMLNLCFILPLWEDLKIWIQLKYFEMPTFWNKVFYWCILSSTCFGYIRPSSGASDVELQHMVFCTEFLDGWWSWELLCSGSQDHHPSKKSVQKNISCSSTSNDPADGRMYVPETCRAKNTSIKLPCFIKMAFQIISWGRWTVKQPSWI